MNLQASRRGTPLADSRTTGAAFQHIPQRWRSQGGLGVPWQDMKAEIQKLHDDISNLPEADAKLPVMMTTQGKWRAVSQTWLLHMLQGWNSYEKLAGVP